LTIASGVGLNDVVHSGTGIILYVLNNEMCQRDHLLTLVGVGL